MKILLKSHVKAHTRVVNGRAVQVRAYDDKRTKKPEDASAPAKTPTDDKNPETLGIITPSKISEVPSFDAPRVFDHRADTGLSLSSERITWKKFGNVLDLGEVTPPDSHVIIPFDEAACVRFWGDIPESVKPELMKLLSREEIIRVGGGLSKDQRRKALNLYLASWGAAAAGYDAVVGDKVYVKSKRDLMPTQNDPVRLAKAREIVGNPSMAMVDVASSLTSSFKPFEESPEVTASLATLRQLRKEGRIFDDHDVLAAQIEYARLQDADNARKKEHIKGARKFLFPHAGGVSLAGKVIRPRTSSADRFGMLENQNIQDAESALSWMCPQFFIATPSRTPLMVPARRASKKEYGGLRSYQREGTIFLQPNASTPVILHEVGHAIEYSDPKIHATCLRFLKKRAGAAPTTAIPMEAVGVMGWADGFACHYVGRDYGGSSTEILSMGIQMMYEDPCAFAVADPEHFNLTYHILTEGRKL